MAGTRLILNFLYTNHYETCWHIVWSEKSTENVDPKVLKTKTGTTMLSSKCAVCGSKKPKFMKEQEAKGVLSPLDLKTPLSKIPLLGDILF